MSMSVSVRGLAEIASHEGLVNRRYKDSVGVWTIGIGHTKAAGAPDPVKITTEQPVADMLALFQKDVVKYAQAVEAAVKVPVTQYEFDAMVSFHYNTGAISRASFVKSLNAGASRATVAAGFMSWSKPAEIIGRRTKEMLLFRDGKYASNPRVNVYPADDNGKVLWSKGKAMDILPLLTVQPEVPAIMPANKAVIHLGSKGPLVAEWQEILTRDGYSIGKVDGDFGPRTEAATKQWQATNGLVNDGVVGPKTWTAAINQSSNQGA